VISACLLTVPVSVAVLFAAVTLAAPAEEETAVVTLAMEVLDAVLGAEVGVDGDAEVGVGDAEVGVDGVVDVDGAAVGLLDGCVVTVICQYGERTGDAMRGGAPQKGKTYRELQ